MPFFSGSIFQPTAGRGLLNFAVFPFFCFTFACFLKQMRNFATRFPGAEDGLETGAFRRFHWGPLPDMLGEISVKFGEIVGHVRKFLKNI